MSGDDERLRAEPVDALRCARARRTEEKELGMHHEESMTQQRREAFWRQYGWSPELPEDQRKKIEDYWSDPEVQEAEALGF